MVSGHRMKASDAATQILPSQLSMSDMWFSICNREKELKMDQFMQIMQNSTEHDNVLKQVLVTL